MLMRGTVRELSNEELHRYAPSIFAEHPANFVSDKYSFVNTGHIIDRCREEGLVPVDVRQADTRTGSGNAGFQKHEVRLVSADILGRIRVDSTFPTVALTNSHNRRAALSIDAGLFRLVCSNGMMAPDAIAESVKVRHVGDMGEILEGVFSVVGSSAELAHKVEEYEDTHLSRDHQMAFATAALDLRKSAMQVTPETILMPRRPADTGSESWRLPKPDLWTTFNVLQENLTKGGREARTATGARTHTRAVKSLNEDQRLNKSLFTLAEEMKKLAA